MTENPKALVHAPIGFRKAAVLNHCPEYAYEWKG